MIQHRILFFDFESFYDSEFSLRKMAPPNYILDPRFEAIGCSFKVDEEKAGYVDAGAIPYFLSQFDPAHTTTVAFNALFDNCILAWHYGFVPSRMYCTMRMAACLKGHLLKSVSLAEVGRLLGCGTKGDTIVNAKGKHRADIISDPEFYRAYREYANNDNEMNHDIFYKLIPDFPVSEWRIMDSVLRCAVEPAFICDTAMLEAHLAELATDKLKMLDEAAGRDLDEASRFKFMRSLRSGPQFEATLKRLGVDIEYKVSPTTGENIPAFAKSDDFMAKLEEHPDPVVQMLAAARLDLRSTIEETRGKRMLSMAQLPWGTAIDKFDYRGQRYGSMPIPLRYSGAHTHRLSGDWKLNFQNLPSGRGGQVSKLRRALCAPEGYKVVVADKAQIECRLNAYVCGQQDLLHAFATGGDAYMQLAQRIFADWTMTKTTHPVERFIGKTGELGLGYGCGAEKFYNMVIRTARGMGLDMDTLMHMWSLQLAGTAVSTYRHTHTQIMQAWRRLDTILKTSWIGDTLPTRFGPCTIGRGYVEGPGGLRMQYANPRLERREGLDQAGNSELCYDYAGSRHKIYGAKFLENIVQFLARINVMDDAVRIQDRRFRFALQAHDELVWVVPDDKVEECKRVAVEEMSRVPYWAPGLPLAVEVGVGQSYGDAK